MTKYYGEYQQAVTRRGHLKRRIENMRSGILQATDPAEEMARVEALEKELQQLDVEVDDLWCLANTGKHRKELEEAGKRVWKPAFGPGSWK